VTLESLITPESGILLVACTAGVEWVKAIVPARIARVSWFRRSLPLLSAVVGAGLAASPFIWADEPLSVRLMGGFIVGALGPFVAGIIKRRKPPKV
jgi:hypothetical protein